MSGGSAGHALAALVTQAPEEEAPSREQEHVTEKQPSKLAQFCSCFKPQKSSHHAAPKLASVVPVAPTAAEDEAATSGNTSRDKGLADDQRKQHSQQQQQPQPRSQEQPQHQQQQQQRPPQGQQQEERREAAAPAGGGGHTAECIWGPNGNEPPQLGPQVGENVGRKTLVLDLDETLVHSSFRTTSAADIVITVELEGEHHRVYVRKRPGVDEFLVQVAKLYEVVVYTASMAKYANPLLDELDKSNTVSFRLFREACTRQSSGYSKDLSKLGRDLKHVIIIDNSPICYALQPDNAIPIRTWRDDTSDRELLDLIPILYSLASVEDIPVVLKQIVWAPDEER